MTPEEIQRLFKKKHTATILMACMREPCTANMIGNKFHIPPSEVNRNLKELERLKLIQLVARGYKDTHYFRCTMLSITITIDKNGIVVNTTDAQLDKEVKRIWEMSEW